MNRTKHSALSLLILAAFATGSLVPQAHSNSNPNALEQGFLTPPPSARPELFWDWMHDMVSREGITYDLEAMKRTGFSGAMIMLVGEVDAGFAPAHRMPNPVKCMSPEFFEHWKFAAGEADRLGLTLVSQCGPGWCHSGGPWITKENAVQHLAFTETGVTGPVPGTVFRLLDSRGGGSPVAADSKASGLVLPAPGADDFTRDVAIVAFPGDIKKLEPGNIVDLTDRVRGGELTWDVPAGRWIIRRFGLKNVNAWNRVAPEGGRGLECDKLSREANKMMFDGMVGRFIANSPKLAGKSILGVEADSWEVGNPEWSPAFRQDFRMRRGYDPMPWVVGWKGGPTVGAEGLDKRFLHDLRLTQTDLFAENFFSYLTELCGKHGMQFMTEGYYGPFDPVRCDGRTSRPMGEFWASGDCMETIRWAASAATTYGRPWVGGESFTGRWNDGAWSIDPYALKRVGDLAFCNGLNKMTMHGSALQPWGGKVKPGMPMGCWGTMFGPGQTWWEPGRAWIDYISRCQFMLQQGHSVADILCLFPSLDWKNTMPSGLHKLYNYDLCSEEMLMKAEAGDGRIFLPHSVEGYRLLVLPPMRAGIEPALLRKILALVKAGATVICSDRPTRAAGLKDYPECDRQVETMVAELWGACDGKAVRENACGKGMLRWISRGTEQPDPENDWVMKHRPGPQFYGRPPHILYWSEELLQVMKGLRVAPDVEVRTAGGPAQVWGGLDMSASGARSGEAAVAWIHRRDKDREIYFVASQVASPMSAELAFRVTGKTPEFWYPDTGAIIPAAVSRTENGRTVVPLRFAPFGSCFVVFRPGTTDSVLSVARDGQPCPEDIAWRNREAVGIETDKPGSYEMKLASGRTATAEVHDLPAPVCFEGPWQVTFPAGWGAPAGATMEAGSWTESADPGIRYFSGTASYAREFEISADRLRPGLVSYLDLGKVKNLAEVVVNGRHAGILWKPPFRMDVTRLLRPGRNRLEIQVTNLWLNRMVGDEQHPDDCEWMPPRRLANDLAGQAIKMIPDWVWTGAPRPQKDRHTFTTWKFYNRETPLLESGLLGPVGLSTSRRVAAGLAGK